eukprot:scaffold241030_cov50-Prasinocladus_malaysianus.AAC.1
MPAATAKKSAVKGGKKGSKKAKLFSHISYHVWNHGPVCQTVTLWPSKVKRLTCCWDTTIVAHAWTHRIMQLSAECAVSQVTYQMTMPWHSLLGANAQSAECGVVFRCSFDPI